MAEFNKESKTYTYFLIYALYKDIFLEMYSLHAHISWDIPCTCTYFLRYIFYIHIFLEIYSIHTHISWDILCACTYFLRYTLYMHIFLEIYFLHAHISWDILCTSRQATPHISPSLIYYQYIFSGWCRSSAQLAMPVTSGLSLVFGWRLRAVGKPPTAMAAYRNHLCIMEM